MIAAQVSFTVGHGESLALVGESGSGKTTIARCVAGLHLPDAGRILLDGELLAGSARHRPVEHRRRIQIVFQNPNASLNPDHTVAGAVARPAMLLRTMGARTSTAKSNGCSSWYDSRPASPPISPRNLGR